MLISVLLLIDFFESLEGLYAEAERGAVWIDSSGGDRAIRGALGRQL